ncbi:MBL fold metallo-hydrolase [candidate division KSB1 bacterium]|nr:MBL fold metallo-hydrolase [candidate division KSB1 bacterium]
MSEKIVLRFFTDLNANSPLLLITVGAEKILVDPGGQVDQNTLARLAAIVNPGEIRWIVVSHYHGDHANLIPMMLSQPQFQGQIACHAATAEIIQSYYKLSAASEPRFQKLEYEKTLPLFSNVELTLFNAGHVLGSAMLYLKINDRRILISGDLGTQFLPIVKPPHLQFPAFPIDLLVLDGKQADRSRSLNLQQYPIRDILYHKLRDCFLFDDGNVLIYIPLSQLPMLIYCLKAIFQQPKYQDLQAKVQYLYLDPQPEVQKLLNIFQRYEYLFDTAEPEFLAHQPNRFQFHKLLFMLPDLNHLQRSIVITPDYGSFHKIFFKLRDHEKNDVLLFYQNIYTVLKGDLDLIDAKCNIQIKRIPFLHLHPDQPELMEWCQALQQQTGLRQVLFYHYQPNLGEKILPEFTRALSIPIFLAHKLNRHLFQVG